MPMKENICLKSKHLVSAHKFMEVTSVLLSTNEVLVLFKHILLCTNYACCGITSISVAKNF